MTSEWSRWRGICSCFYTTLNVSSCSWRGLFFTGCTVVHDAVFLQYAVICWWRAASNCRPWYAGVRSHVYRAYCLNHISVISPHLRVSVIKCDPNATHRPNLFGSHLHQPHIATQCFQVFILNIEGLSSAKLYLATDDAVNCLSQMAMKALARHDKKHLKNVGPIGYCEPFYIVIHQVLLLPPLSHAACASMSMTTTTAWQRGPLWPHGMGPIRLHCPSRQRHKHAFVWHLSVMYFTV